MFIIVMTIHKYDISKYIKKKLKIDQGEENISLWWKYIITMMKSYHYDDNHCDENKWQRWKFITAMKIQSYNKNLPL